MEEAGEQRDIIIVGGGICGLATALALHRKGIKTMVIERSKTLRCSGAAIIVQANGWRALDRLGIASKLRQLAVPISTAHYIALDGGKSKEIPLGDGEMRCLRRADLMQVLAGDLPPNTVRFGCKMLSINLDPITSHPNIQIDDGSVLRAKIVIGCDGVNSTVANFLEMKSTRLFSTCVVRGLTKYRSGHKFQNEFVVTAGKGNVQLGRVPIDDMVVYWFLTRRWTSQDSMVSNDPKLIKESTVKELSSKSFPKEDVEMIRNSDRDQLFLTPLRYRAPWDLLLQTRFRKGTITVAGDAMHAMGPFIAQGGSASLEDAIVLTRCLAKTISVRKHTDKKEWRIMVKMAIDEYVEERKMRVVLLTAQTFLIGMILDNSAPLSVVKLMCVGLMAILFSDPNRHCLYDCGHL